MANSLIISIASFIILVTFETNVFSDTSTQEALKNRMRSLNSYYSEYSKLGRPQGKQLEALKTKVLIPSRAAYRGAIDAERREMESKSAQSAKESTTQTIRELSQQFSTMGKTEKEREKIKDSLKNAINGNAPNSRLTKTTAKDGSSPASPVQTNSSKSRGFSSSNKEQVVLDGSNIPKELSFPGAKPKK